jgi:NAD(P)H-hydrate epimerase
MDIPVYTGEVPYLTTEQMMEVDRAMMEDYGIGLVQMMENAGMNLAHLARVRFLASDPRGKRVVVLAGSGGNGGGALVCARRLHNYGAQVSVFLTRPAADLKGVPAQQLEILGHMDIFTGKADSLNGMGTPDLILYGVIGYSLRGAPRGTAAELIHWANGQEAPILALDVPSGVDAASGRIFDPAVQATATMTLALPKEGLRAPEAKGWVGELYLADISVPPALYAEPALGLNAGYLFAESDIIRLL